MPYYSMPDQEKLYVREIGRGEPILMLSGLGMSSWQWLPFIAPSLNYRRFIIPDYRGFGGSQRCKIPHDLNAIESHWQDIHCLIQQMNITEIDVIGYSMGATTTMHGLKYGNFAQYIKNYLQIDQTAKIKNDATWQFGLFGQQQAEFLTLLDNICSVLLQHKDRYQRISQLPSTAQKQLAQLWLQFMKLQKPNSKLTQMMQHLPVSRLQSKLLPMQSIAYILWYLQTYLAHDEDYRTALASLDKPTSFIIGRQSALYDYRGQLQVAEQLEQADVHVLAKSGHVPFLNQPLSFTHLLNKILRQF